MVEQKSVKFQESKKSDAASKKPADPKKAVSKPKKAKAYAKKSLAYGKVQFKAFLWHGKWRFVNKAEAEKTKKKKLAKLAKLKEQGKEIKVLIETFISVMWLIRAGYSWK